MTTLKRIEINLENGNKVYNLHYTLEDGKVVSFACADLTNAHNLEIALGKVETAYTI